MRMGHRGGIADKRDKHIVASATCQKHVDTRGCHFYSSLALALHATTTGTGLFRLYVLADIMSGTDHRNERNSLISGTSIIKPIHITQQNECVSSHKACNEAGKFVIIGEHELSDAHGVVLVHHRQDAMRKHNLHATAHVLAMLLGIEIVLLRQDLSHGDMMLAQEIVVAVDEFCLSHGREQLALLHGIHLQSALKAKMKFSPTRCHSTRGDEQDLYTTMTQLGNLVHKRGETGDIESAVGTGENGTAYLYGNSFHVDSL